MSAVSSVCSDELHVVIPPDMNLATESKRILYVLDRAIARAEFVGTLAIMLRDDGAMLQDVLDPEAQFAVIEFGRAYEMRNRNQAPSLMDSETSSMSEDGKSLHSGLSSVLSGSLSPRSADLSRRGSKVKGADRIDSDLSRIILSLEENPRIQEMAQALRHEISLQMKFFIKCLKELRNGIAHHIGETAAQAKTRENYLRECYMKNEQAKKEITKMEEALVTQKAEAKACIIGKNILINRHNKKIDKMHVLSREAVDRRVKESEKEMATEWRTSQALQDTLKIEAEAVTKKLEANLKDHLAMEKILRVRRAKVENQLLGWLQKFDQEIGEKQAEEEDIQALFDEEKKQLEAIEVKLDEQEEEYDELMQEKAQYEQEVLEQKLYVFILNRSARRIQRAFRMFKARKAAKKKAKKEKKGKKAKKK